MSSDLTGALRTGPAPAVPPLLGQAPPRQAALLAAAMSVLVAGGTVLAMAPVVRDLSGPAVRLYGHADTAALTLLPGATEQVYPVLRNGSGHPVRIEDVVLDGVRLRPGSAGPGCRASDLTVRVGAAGLELDPDRTAMLTADVTLDPGAGSCRGAVFDLSFTASTRQSRGSTR